MRNTPMIVAVEFDMDFIVAVHIIGSLPYTG